jgi:arylsulfatase A-like enzyme
VQWEGYETDALSALCFEYLDIGRDPDRPFCLMVNPHQPHPGAIKGSDRMAPEKYYDRLPAELPRPDALDESAFKALTKEFRDYYALIMAVDDMLGDIVAGLEERGLLESTILVFTTDHGTQLGTHPIENCSPFWAKKMPWETNVRIPMVIHWPEAFGGGRRCDTLSAPVDLLPTFCGLCDIKIPPTVEGLDLSRAWRGETNATEQDAVYMMNFTYRFNWCKDGWEWRGVRTKTHTYARFGNGETYLFDNGSDPWQQNNLADAEEHRELVAEYEDTLQAFMKKRNDRLTPGSHYENWFDEERRVVRNAYGPLPDPESEPDWSLLD